MRTTRILRKKRLVLVALASLALWLLASCTGDDSEASVPDTASAEQSETPAAPTVASITPPAAKSLAGVKLADDNVPDHAGLPDMGFKPGSRQISSEDGSITVELNGDCRSVPFQLAVNSGFEGGHLYQTQAWVIKGDQVTPYTYLEDVGFGPGINVSNQDGSLPKWSWDCMDGPGGRPDQPGLYVVRVTDLDTRQALVFKFTVPDGALGD